MVMSRQYMVGGIAAACIGLGYLAYRYSDDGRGSALTKSPDLSKALTITILKDLRNELAQIYTTIASFAMSIKEQSGNRVGDNEVKEILMTQTPIKIQMIKAEQKVYEKHTTLEEAFQHACTTLYSEDAEVQNLIRSMKTNLENSFKGIPPKMEGDLPAFLDAQLTLEIMRDMNDSAKLSMYEIIEDIRSKGIPINQQDPQFQYEIEKRSGKIEMEQYKVFDQHGLNNLGQPASIIIQSAMQKFAMSDPMFIQGFSRDQEEVSRAMQMIMNGTFPRDEADRIRDRLRGRPLIEELDFPREVVDEQFLDEDLEEEAEMAQ